ncbi:YbjN domain-containing protein [Micromonospora sp. NPDC050686]|uniref:YbjN domain-containing protein n=1 Tax=Micromonospora sp. NPDC050686 TaxID=3154631 RepID=UPI0033C8FD30
MASPEIDGPLGGPVRALRPLTRQLLAAVLEARGYVVSADADGDLVGRWDDSLIWFLRLGDAGELLQVRTVAAAAFPIERVPDLYAFCNAWNHDRLWPKAYVHVGDDGRAVVCGETVTDLEAGVTPHQLGQLLDRGISTGCQLAAAVDALPGGTRP